MMEPKKTPKIIELMGKEKKKQSRKAHQFITSAFRERKDGADPAKEKRK